MTDVMRAGNKASRLSPGTKGFETNLPEKALATYIGRDSRFFAHQPW